MITSTGMGRRKSPGEDGLFATCSTRRQWLLAWRGRIVANPLCCESGKDADSGKPLKVVLSPFLHFCSSGPPWRGRVGPYFRAYKKKWIRIGEATKPGPPTLERPSGGQSYARGNIKVLTVNAGGWAPALHSLSLKLYDIVFVQETWLMEGSIRSATFQASQQGYEGVFCPARKDKTLGRGKGGLAILSRLGTPMLRATDGPQAELGRWMHALIQVRPGECLHTGH
eukprot:5431552-Amphidinium_carterae.1